jgi:hypothetical protein
MLPLPTVQDIQTYLSDNAWQQARMWRGASVWAHADGHEVLVPPRDDLADTGLRVRELLKVLTAAEDRPADDILADISAPLDDVQSFRTFPAGMPGGFTSLDAGIGVLRAVQNMIGVAARTVVEGPLPEFAGRSAVAAGLLRRVRLGPGRAGSYIFTVRVPADARDVADGRDTRDARDSAGVRDSAGTGDEPLGRQAGRQLYEAVTAVRTAIGHAEQDGLTAFNDAVTAGVSSNLCRELSVLAGQGRAQAFEVTFRWGRGLRSDLAADTVRFTEGDGRVIGAAARHLRQVRISGAAEVTGYVESLHDQPETADRWRIKVRGDLATGGGTRFSRSVWIRLDRQDSYDRAIAAHRDRLLVRARGEFSAVRGRVELSAGSAKFEVIG